MCLAVGAMFVSCGDSKKSSKSGEDGSASVAGCTCDITTEGETVTVEYDPTEMKGYSVSSCSALEAAIKQAAIKEGITDAKGALQQLNRNTAVSYTADEAVDTEKLETVKASCLKGTEMDLNA